MDQKLSYEEIGRCCASGILDIEPDSVLRMSIGAFLKGESRMLADTAELGDAQGGP